MARKLIAYEKRQKKGEAPAVREKSASYKNDADTVQKLLRYKRFEVQNFRCIKKLAISPLEQVNLIAGMNNVGKTTLLEALFLHIGETNPELALRVNNWRGLGPEIESPWRQLFWQFNDKSPIKLTATTMLGKECSLTITTKLAESKVVEEILPKKGTEFVKSSGVNIVFDYVNEDGKSRKVMGTPFLIGQGNIVRFELRMSPPSLPTRVTGIFLNSGLKSVLDEDVNRFSQLRIKQRDKLLLDAMQLIEPRLERLEILSPQGTTLIYGYLKDYQEPVPMPLLGDGARRLASLILAICTAQGGVVLVDEIENGIHHSILKGMWNAVAESASLFNTQIYATTNSQECLVAAHEAFKERNAYRFRLHRLDRLNGEIAAATYDQESLEGALSIPLEVRG